MITNLTIVSPVTPPVIVQQQNPQVTITGVTYIQTYNFQQFSIIATTPGQTVFTLPSNPILILLCTIQGISQSQLAGDFTLSGNVITFSSGVTMGQLVAGVYV